MQSRQKITRDFPKAISSTQSESSALPSQVSFHSKLQLKPFSAKCPPGNGLRWWYCWHLPALLDLQSSSARSEKSLEQDICTCVYKLPGSDRAHKNS